jgi:carbamate kinase
MRLVIALGGNALLRRGEEPEVATQRRHVRDAVAALAPLARHHEVILTHGNGPQVGLLAERLSDPLDVLGAESEGLIGYLLELELHNALPDRACATLLTQTLVAADDPAFAHPTKPIGLADASGERRRVPSPEPRDIVELPAIRALLDAGILVICGGGGGVPVVAGGGGRLTGVEGVVDKDLAAALLAESLGADGLLLLTDVPAVAEGFGTPDERPIATLSASDLTRLDLAEGSMGPKVLAAVRFAERTGGFAAIGALEEAVAIVAGERGTRVTPVHTKRRRLVA